jgi:CTP-dependent riboflavin kinase
VGIAVRQVSRDGKVLTITDKGTNRKGQAFSQLLLFDKQ